MRNAGASHQLLLLPANDHAFDLNWSGFAHPDARAKLRVFLEKYGS